MKNSHFMLKNRRIPRKQIMGKKERRKETLLLTVLAFSYSWNREIKY